MLDGFSATMAQRRLSRCIFGPRGSHSWRADGEIMRRDCVFQGREFTKRSLIESNAIRVEDYGLFGEAVIVNPQQAEVMLSDGRHDYGLWPRLIRRMSSVQLKFESGHLVQTEVKKMGRMIERARVLGSQIKQSKHHRAFSQLGRPGCVANHSQWHHTDITIHVDMEID
jgi:hypothetical protein